MTDDENYFLCNEENWWQPIEMKLYEKLNMCAQFFTAILKATFNFKHFENKDESESLCLSRITGSEIGADVNV